MEWTVWFVVIFTYKSVQSPVIEQLNLEKEPASPHDEFAVAVIKDFHPDSGPHSKNYSQIMWYLLHEGFCLLLYNWEKEKKG